MPLLWLNGVQFLCVRSILINYRNKNAVYSEDDSVEPENNILVKIAEILSGA